MVRPTSSTTSREAGNPGEGMAALCAWEGAAAHKKKLIAAQAVEGKRGRVITCKVLSLSKYYLSQSIFSCRELSFAKCYVSQSILSCTISLDEKSAGNKKAPRDARGLPASLFLAKSAGPLRHGRVAWLTADSADHSGGTAADSHGLPRFPCLQIEKSV